MVSCSPKRPFIWFLHLEKNKLGIPNMSQKMSQKKEKSLRNKEIFVKKKAARMSALGTALLCTFIEKAFKGLKGLVVFWRSSLLKGKIVALQFFVLLLFTDLKRLLKPERRLLWCKDHCFKNAEFYFWKKCFGHELHSFLAREYKRLPLSFDIFMNRKILNTVITMVENYSKCRIWVFQFWHFPPIFVI